METDDYEKLSGELFQLTMQKDWKQVAKLYQDKSESHEVRLTNYEDTALHIAISSYQLGRYASDDVSYIDDMIMSISKRENSKDRYSIFSTKNKQGNTPLHLAAMVGWVHICESLVSAEQEYRKLFSDPKEQGETPLLISIRNVNGETPLFVASHHGETEAFLFLHKHCKERHANGVTLESVKSLCRRGSDGHTALHSAISGAHFELAYYIISHHKILVGSKNTEGESPLHILAKKPGVFKSSSHLKFYESIIYHCLFIEELKVREYISKPKNNLIVYNTRSGVDYPQNYQTCWNSFRHAWNLLLLIFSADRGTDTDQENQRAMSQTESCPKLYRLPVKTEHPKDERRNERRRYDLFPINYNTGVSLFKFMMTILLTVVGIGYEKIKRLKEKKERYSHALHIMNQMIESETHYKYHNNGKQPMEKLTSERIKPPDSPPSVTDKNSANSDEVQNHTEKDPVVSGDRIDEQIPKGSNGGGGKDRGVENGPRGLTMNESSLLVAAKMGIPEMVEKIITQCPISINDLDSKGKNVLMLAAENRHTVTFDYLMTQKKLPNYMVHHVDNDGNSVLHLAARAVKFYPWRIPGAALQMQWEIKWYKHVKHSVKYFAHINYVGETPRQIFTETHKELLNESTGWLIQTAESCSFVAALIATVAFATSATVPGGLNDATGRPTLVDQLAFDIFSVSSLVALCLSVTALVFFLAIITSRCQERDFKLNLPGKLLFGLTSLFAAIAFMLVSFCAGHTFIMRDKLRIAVVPIYVVACVPVTLFATAQLPLYFDLLWAVFAKVPLRSYKVFYQ